MSQRGFTLIEVMVVIVVMGIVASLVLMNISGMDRRKAMQARDMMILDLKQINRLANEQAQVLTLELKTVNNALGYQVLQYYPEQSDVTQRWQVSPVFALKKLPEHMHFEITAIEYTQQNANNQDLLADQAPKIMWLGNGEAKPVRIQAYLAQQPIGTEIEIDYLGKVHVQ